LALLLSFDIVYLCFDIDRAGIEAFKKAKELLTEIGIELFRIKLPRHQDVNSIGVDNFKKYFKRAKKVY
ncbi:MAG: toprim domain-containing protein, partial [Candidatus Hodarchaeales archaeon]